MKLALVAAALILVSVPFAQFITGCHVFNSPAAFVFYCIPPERKEQ